MKVLFSINQYQGEDYILVLEYIAQQVSFLSFTECLASLRVPQGRELQFREFGNWLARHRTASKLKDPQQLFEEFKGVLTGAPGESPWLSLDEYLPLVEPHYDFIVVRRVNG